MFSMKCIDANAGEYAGEYAGAGAECIVHCTVCSVLPATYEDCAVETG